MFSMENKLRKRACMASSNPASLAMHRDSQTISKNKPKIRIIHIFAPEIIKTDVENFRELVQRLTGKPTDAEKKYCKKQPVRSSSGLSHDQKLKMMGKKMEEIQRNGIWGLDQSMERECVKEEEVGFCNDENSGGYLGGFSDLEGFISELSEFSLLPLDDSHIQGFI